MKQKAEILPPMERYGTWIRVAGYCAAIAGSCLFAEACSRLNVSFPVQMLLLIPWLAVLSAVCMAVNALWFRQLTDAADALSPLQSGDPDRYIDAINALLARQKSRRLQNLRRISLISAYMAKKDYQTVKNLLEQIDLERLDPSFRPSYWTALAISLFFLGDSDAMLDVMEAHKPVFDEQREAGPMAQAVSLLDIFSAAARDDPQTARILLQKARQRWTDEDSAEYYQKLDRALSETP